ncbi:hypothetical protein AtEden1_Chr2g0271041 [Arabidopsis thaliana]
MTDVSPLSDQTTLLPELASEVRKLSVCHMLATRALSPPKDLTVILVGNYIFLGNIFPFLGCFYLATQGPRENQK